MFVCGSVLASLALTIPSVYRCKCRGTVSNNFCVVPVKIFYPILPATRFTWSLFNYIDAVVYVTAVSNGKDTTCRPAGIVGMTLVLEPSGRLTPRRTRGKLLQGENGYVEVSRCSDEPFVASAFEKDQREPLLGPRHKRKEKKWKIGVVVATGTTENYGEAHFGYGRDVWENEN
ncbi:hypothetical protein TNCV_3350091 [Trichonephila clavipes]|nr:hypothetical protein TNCV_3350091 [Trichonephila clavipes]